MFNIAKNLKKIGSLRDGGFLRGRIVILPLSARLLFYRGQHSFEVII
jgi:hypothetical protein